MSALTSAWMMTAAVWGSGFLVGTVFASRRRPTCRELMRERSSKGNCQPMPPAPPYSSAAIAWRDAEAQRIYRGAMWREKGSDVWQPLGEPIDFTELARQQLNRTTPPLKPQPPGGHLMHEGQLFGGYQPRPQGGITTPSPHTP